MLWVPTFIKLEWGYRNQYKKHVNISIYSQEKQDAPLIWCPMTNYITIDQSEMAVLWQSWDHTRAWDVKGERPRTCCSSNVNERDWWWTPREQGCCYILSFSYLFLVIISHWSRSRLTQIWAIVPSVSLYDRWCFWGRFSAGGKRDTYLRRHLEEVRHNLQTTNMHVWN